MSGDEPYRLHGGPPALIDPEAPCPVCDELLGEMRLPDHGDGENLICWLVYPITTRMSDDDAVDAVEYALGESPLYQSISLAHRSCAEEALKDA